MRLQPLIDALRDLLLSEPALPVDEAPVPMLVPGKKKAHRAYLWAYATTPYAELKAVVYDFSEGRGGPRSRASAAAPPGTYRFSACICGAS